MCTEWKMSAVKVMSATLLVVIACHFQLCASAAMFTVHPQNQTLPLNSMVEFTCDGEGHDVVWVVYLPGLPFSLTSDTRRAELIARGVTVVDLDGNLTRLQFTGILDKNTTRVRCRIFNGDTVFSDPATLTLIGPPLAPQPTFTPLSASAISITWNEPFTWEGYPVLSYNFKIYETLDSGNMLLSTVETTERDYVVPSNELQGTDCTVYLFGVQAASAIGSGSEGTVAGGFPIAPTNFRMSNLEIEVTFGQEGDPRAMITIEHPEVCQYQDIDYSVTIERSSVNTSEKRSSRIELEFTNKPASQGSFSFEVVDSKLVPSRDYLLTVTATTEAGNATTTMAFATYFEPPTTPSSDSTVLLGAIVGAAVGLVAVIVVVCILVCVAYCCCIKRKKNRAPDSIKNPYDVHPKVIERSQELAYETIDQYQTNPLRRPESPYQSMVPVPDSFPALPPERKSELIEPGTPSTTYDKNINQCSNVDTVPIRLEATNRPECYYSIVSEDFYTTMDPAGTLASQSQLSQETTTTMYAVNVPDNDTADRCATEC